MSIKKYRLAAAHLIPPALKQVGVPIGVFNFPPEACRRLRYIELPISFCRLNYNELAHKTVSSQCMITNFPKNYKLFQISKSKEHNKEILKIYLLNNCFSLSSLSVCLYFFRNYFIFGHFFKLTQIYPLK